MYPFPNEKPLVDSDYILEKFQGKGGWTYARVPEVVQSKDTPFGWVNVKGSIDTYVFTHYKLMPMGNGSLFLPVKAEIRKAIRKKEGDTVHVVLYHDNSNLTVPQEILECFQNEPKELYDIFNSFSDADRKYYIDWIQKAKTDQKRADRIVTMLQRLEKGLRFYD